MGGDHPLNMKLPSRSACVKLILIRHAQSENNSLGRIQGGGPLDAYGLTQVGDLLSHFQNLPISHIFVSPTKRTMQTASPISKSHNLRMKKTNLLTDIDFGDYSSMDAKTAQNHDPIIWREWRASPHKVSFPNGGNLEMVRKRILVFFQELLTLENEPVVLAVTHDSPIRIAASIALGMGDDNHHNLRAQTASITTISLSGDNVRLIGLFGETSHLTNIGK